MFAAKAIDFSNKPDAYRELDTSLRALLDGERDPIANLANTASLIFQALPDVNWAGFYRLAGNTLMLGPFHGKPACVRIPVGKGVCGMAADRRQTVLVKNVREFPGHIACDAASASEIVVPMIKEGVLLGVLDLDSPRLNRFDAEDQAGLERLAATMLAATDWDTIARIL